MAREYSIVGSTDAPNAYVGTPAVDDENDLAFYNWFDSANNVGRIYSVDISDPTNPQQVDFLEAEDDAALTRLHVDIGERLLFAKKGDPSGSTPDRGWWSITYDAQGNLSLASVWSPIDDATTNNGNPAKDSAIWPAGAVLIGSRNDANDGSTLVDILSYAGGLSQSAELDPSGGNHFVSVDRSRGVAIVSPDADVQEHAIIDLSGPSVVHQEPFRAGVSTVTHEPDPDRDLFYLLDRGNNEVSVIEWDGSWTQRGVLNPTGSDPLNIAYSIGTPDFLYLTDGNYLIHIDVSDPDNPTETDSQTAWPSSSRTVEQVRWAPFNGGARLWAVDRTAEYIAVVDSDVLARPDKPTCSVDAVGDESADFSSSAYSHPNDVAHQDSKWEVRKQGATDWTASSLVYDSGWTTEDLEAHTASPLPLDEDLEMRVCHRDTNGEFACSDLCPLSTTAEIKSGEGPEGLFFGEENGNRILRFGRAFQDDGNLITAVLESNHVAPAGARGEVVVRSAHLSLEYGTDLRLVLTPIIDGTEVTEARATVNLSARSRIRETIEVALAQDVTGSAGNVVAKVGLRGSWLGMKIEATDRIGHGFKVNLESVEYEVEVVRELAESVNVSA